MTTLVSLSGLPGVGKTTLARALATHVAAIHLRVDSVEAAMRSSALTIHSAEDAGYLTLAAIAKDNLFLGFDVIADTVNPVEATRRLWAETAGTAGADLLNVEVVCSDQAVHRNRVEARESETQGIEVPNWHDVAHRAFEPWRDTRVIVDTGIRTIQECVATIAAEMGRPTP